MYIYYTMVCLLLLLPDLLSLLVVGDNFNKTSSFARNSCELIILILCING